MRRPVPPESPSSRPFRRPEESSMAQFDMPLAELERYTPERDEPDDFDAFWRDTLGAAAAHELAPEFTPYDALLPGVRIHDVRYAGYAGERVAGWFLTPPDAAGPLPCVVQFIGYGGGRGRPHEWLLWPAAGYAVLVMDSRGQGDGDTPDLPGVGPQHPGLRGAIIDVPFLTHYRRATEITDEYPYRELADMCATNRDRIDQVFHTLGYFDGLHFAARATAPALYAVGLMDAVCPPSTVFAAYHHYAGPKELRVWPYNGHEGGDTFQPE